MRNIKRRVLFLIVFHTFVPQAKPQCDVFGDVQTMLDESEIGIQKVVTFCVFCGGVIFSIMYLNALGSSIAEYVDAGCFCINNVGLEYTCHDNL